MEKLIAEKLPQFCDAKLSLHWEQIGGWKYRSTIDTATYMIYKVHEIWENK